MSYITAKILYQMSDLYTKFCMPNIVINTKTGEVTQSYKWVNQEAEEAFKCLQEIFAREQQAEQRRDAEQSGLALMCRSEI